MAIKELAEAFNAADEIWQIELENTFPDANVARYVPRGRGKTGTPLRAAYDARENARRAWENAVLARYLTSKP